jgi:hypothetical protein
MSELYVWTCGQCGSEQAMTKEANVVLRQSSATFYCVHGHARHYPQGKTMEERLRDQLEAERRERQRAEQNVAMWADDARQAREEAEHQRRRANGYKGHATRITKRAKAGVCPCCNRTFTQLARHMATQHPEFTPEAPEPPALRIVA